MTPSDIALYNRSAAQERSDRRKASALRTAKIVLSAAILALLLWGVR